jgi:hypothetical protein
MKKVIVGKSKGIAEAEQCDIHVVTNSYFLKDTEYKKMLKLGSNTIKMQGGSGIGIGVSCLDKKGNWVDITDYNCW